MTNKTKNIKFLQINLGRSRLAHENLEVVVREECASIILISEPNIKISNEKKYFLDDNGDAAIAIMGHDIGVQKVVKGNGYVAICTDDALIVSAYISPNVGQQEADVVLEAISHTIKLERRLHTIVAGDFNAKAKEWGNIVENRRGRKMLEWMGDEDMYFLNDGRKPTFVRGDQVSFIDLTMCRLPTLNLIREWMVRDEVLSCSLHRFVSFLFASVSGNTSPRVRGLGEKTGNQMGWKYVADEHKDVFTRTFAQLCEVQEITKAEHLESTLIDACNSALPKKKSRNNLHEPVYWWTEDIATIRRNCIRKMRKVTRINRTRASQEEKNLARREFKQAKLELRLAILKSKEDGWRRICEEVEVDVWGIGYKIATKKLTSRPKKLTMELESKVLTTLFPQSEVTQWDHMLIEEGDIVEITLDELAEALLASKSKKAPGPDGISADILKAAGLMCPTVLLEVYNGILRTGFFPLEWKEARVVLIPKPGKPEFHPTSYRPLCLLNTAGKLFEAILTRRLHVILGENGLSKNQFGFRPGRSTLQAITKLCDIADDERKKTLKTRNLCLAIALDIRNAFGTAPWSRIIEAMESKNIPRYMVRLIKSYFQNRKLITPNGNSMEMHAGVPTGSVIGPILWNIFYDGVLQLEVPNGVTLIGYADDLAIVVTAKTESELETKAEQVLNGIVSWLKEHGLGLAPEKTEAVLLIGRKKCGTLNFHIDGVAVTVRSEMKYLGVLLDKRLSFGPHVNYVKMKATCRANALAKIMPRTGGASSQRRILLYRVVESTLLYAAPCWRRAGLVKLYVDRLVSAQRCMLIRVVGAYRTVSTAALQVVAGIVPIHLMVEERGQMGAVGEEEKRERRELTISKWNREWQQETRGEWTRKVIPDISLWVKRKHGTVDFHLTQVLTGHGCFCSYLHRFKKRDSPYCRYCDEEDTAAHTMFNCVRWTVMRERVEIYTGEVFDEAEMVNVMLKNVENWRVVARFVGEVMRTKEADERQEQEFERRQREELEIGDEDIL